MRKIAYAQTPAALFAAPAQCTRIGGASSANGGSAECSMEATTQGQVALEGAAMGKPAQRAGDPDRLAGVWDFAGRDGAGSHWRGTLTLKKLEQNRFDSAPFSGEDSHKYSFTALLSWTAQARRKTHGWMAPQELEPGRQLASPANSTNAGRLGRQNRPLRRTRASGCCRSGAPPITTPAD
jgi:hypothetical protein